MQENVKDKDLREWVIPAFSTTTPTDRAVGSILLMCSLKAYFSYEAILMCGIPSVTLEGSEDDWKLLHSRLSKLNDFDSNPDSPLKSWHNLLAPLITNFIDCFTAFSPTGDPARADELRDFFQKIAKIQSGGSGSPTLDGWITFFCPFDTKGKWQLHPSDQRGFWRKPYGPDIFGPSMPHAEWTAQLDTTDVPLGYSEVDMHLNDNGEEMETTLIAGMAGYRIEGEDTIAPAPGWWIFVKDEEALKEREAAKREAQRKRLEDLKARRGLRKDL